MEEQLLPRHIVQRRQYDRQRYARHLTQEELNQRIRDVLLNILDLSENGKIGVGPLDTDFEVWSEKWAHVLEEMQLRHGPYPRGFAPGFLKDSIPFFASELGKKAAAAIALLGLRKDEVFIKFGKACFMTALHESGSLRIQPASYFADTSHNSAVQDDELTRHFSLVLSGEDVRKLVMNPQDLPEQVLDQRVDVQFTFPTDYHLYCLTTSVKPRLFVDFDAEACVIIRDRTAFTTLLQTKVAERLPHSLLRSGSAQYIDPLLPTPGHVVVPLCKHFRYGYQREYRFCWLPPEPAKQLAPVDVEIGSLEGIADLILL